MSSVLTSLPTGTLAADYIYGVQGGSDYKYHGNPAVNVLDYGATGDGVTDDTVAIQAALDAAFGTYASPHGGLPAGYVLNRPVYFPHGSYNVTSPASATITGAVDNGSGLIRLTLSTTLNALFVNNVPVCVNGVAGTIEANGLFFITKIDATHVDLLGSQFVHTYSGSGATMKMPALKLRARGALIYGDGRLSTTISCSTAAAATISTNGFDYSIVRDIGFAATTNGTPFDLNWMTPDATGVQIALQSNTFNNCNFGGSSSKFGLSIGYGGNMGSENLILNCYISGATVGLGIGNFNALQMSIIGGNIASCSYGIRVESGSIPIIHGVGFQLNTTYDISIVRTVGDAASIHGCRSESVNFLLLQSGNAAHVACCTHLNVSAGVFASVEGGSGVFAGSLCLDNNYSLNGTVAGNGEFFMRGNFFANTAPLSGINTSTGVVHSYDNVGKNPCTVANLPAAGAYVNGLHMMVTDGSVVASGNFGAIVAGSGANKVPVYCDGTNWRIG